MPRIMPCLQKVHVSGRSTNIFRRACFTGSYAYGESVRKIDHILQDHFMFPLIPQVIHIL
jgi:hypothetical protein